MQPLVATLLVLCIASGSASGPAPPVDEAAKKESEARQSHHSMSVGGTLGFGQTAVAGSRAAIEAKIRKGELEESAAKEALSHMDEVEDKKRQRMEDQYKKEYRATCTDNCKAYLPLSEVIDGRPYDNLLQQQGTTKFYKLVKPDGIDASVVPGIAFRGSMAYADKIDDPKGPKWGSIVHAAEDEDTDDILGQHKWLKVDWQVVYLPKKIKGKKVMVQMKGKGSQPGRWSATNLHVTPDIGDMEALPFRIEKNADDPNFEDHEGYALPYMEVGGDALKPGSAIDEVEEEGGPEGNWLKYNRPIKAMFPNDEAAAAMRNKLWHHDEELQEQLKATGSTMDEKTGEIKAGEARKMAKDVVDKMSYATGKELDDLASMTEKINANAEKMNLTGLLSHVPTVKRGAEKLERGVDQYAQDLDRFEGITEGVKRLEAGWHKEVVNKIDWTLKAARLKNSDKERLSNEINNGWDPTTMHEPLPQEDNQLMRTVEEYRRAKGDPYNVMPVQEADFKDWYQPGADAGAFFSQHNHFDDTALRRQMAARKEEIKKMKEANGNDSNALLQQSLQFSARAAFLSPAREHQRKSSVKFEYPE